MATTELSSSIPDTPAPSYQSQHGTSLFVDNAYIKEIQKNIRNVTKKIGAMAKLDAVMSEYPNFTLDELVAQRKINLDQKAQALKKPGLQAQLLQLEAQLQQQQRLQDDLEAQAKSKIDAIVHQEKAKAQELEMKLQSQNRESLRAALRSHLLTISLFLKTAAQRRMEEPEDSPESKAFESVLSYLYGGDQLAVDAMEKLITSARTPVPSLEGQNLPISYERVKEISLSQAPSTDNVLDIAPPMSPADTESLAPHTESDPTMVTATMSELQIERPLISPDSSKTIDDSQQENGVVEAAPSVTLADNFVNTAPYGPDWTQSTPPMIGANDPAELGVDADQNLTSVTYTTGLHTAKDKEHLPSQTTSLAIPANTPNAEQHGFQEVHHRNGGRTGRGRGEQGRDRGGRGRSRGGPRGRGRGRASDSTQHQ